MTQLSWHAMLDRVQGNPAPGEQLLDEIRETIARAAGAEPDTFTLTAEVERRVLLDLVSTQAYRLRDLEEQNAQLRQRLASGETDEVRAQILSEVQPLLDEMRAERRKVACSRCERRVDPEELNYVRDTDTNVCDTCYYRD